MTLPPSDKQEGGYAVQPALHVAENVEHTLLANTISLQFLDSMRETSVKSEGGFETNSHIQQSTSNKDEAEKSPNVPSLVLGACQRCRKTKRKCDKTYPVCERCQASGAQCTYTIIHVLNGLMNGNKPKASEEETSGLSEKVESLQKMVATLAAEINDMKQHMATTEPGISNANASPTSDGIGDYAPDQTPSPDTEISKLLTLLQHQTGPLDAPPPILSATVAVNGSEGYKTSDDSEPAASFRIRHVTEDEVSVDSSANTTIQGPPKSWNLDITPKGIKIQTNATSIAEILRLMLKSMDSLYSSNTESTGIFPFLGTQTTSPEDTSNVGHRRSSTSSIYDTLSPTDTNDELSGSTSIIQPIQFWHLHGEGFTLHFQTVLSQPVDFAPEGSRSGPPITLQASHELMAHCIDIYMSCFHPFKPMFPRSIFLTYATAYLGRAKKHDRTGADMPPTGVIFLLFALSAAVASHTFKFHQSHLWNKGSVLPLTVFSEEDTSLNSEWIQDKGSEADFHEHMTSMDTDKPENSGLVSNTIQNGEYFYAHAREILTELFDTEDLWTVAALHYLAVYCLHRSRERALHYHSMSMRMAVTLGCCNESGVIGGTPEEKEIGRRIWWTLCKYAQMIEFVGYDEVPTGLHSISIPLPSPLSSEPPEDVVAIQATNCIYRFSFLLDEISRADLTRHDNPSDFARCHRNLLELSQEVPEEFSLEATKIEALASPVSDQDDDRRLLIQHEISTIRSTFALYIRLWELLCQMMLHSDNLVAPPDPSATSKQSSTESWLICVSSAYAAVECFELLYVVDRCRMCFDDASDVWYSCVLSIITDVLLRDAKVGSPITSALDLPFFRSILRSDLCDSAQNTSSADPMSDIDVSFPVFNTPSPPGPTSHTAHEGVINHNGITYVSTKPSDYQSLSPSNTTFIAAPTRAKSTYYLNRVLNIFRSGAMSKRTLYGQMSYARYLSFLEKMMAERGYAEDIEMRQRNMS